MRMGLKQHKQIAEGRGPWEEAWEGSPVRMEAGGRRRPQQAEMLRLAGEHQKLEEAGGTLP